MPTFRICETVVAFVLVVSLLTSTVCSQIPKPTDAPKPLTPEQSAAAFQLPRGFRMEVVASEPLIASPSAVCWDGGGRMFVCELHGYNLEGQLDIEELNKTGKLDTQVRRVQADEKFKEAAKSGTYGVVKLLTDVDGDGRMDKADVWAKDLPPAYGLVPSNGGVIVACAPDIVFLADRDADGVAEVRETLFTGFRTGALERGINAPQWSVDGWIYFGRGWGGGHITGPQLEKSVDLSDSDFRIRADGSAIEPITGGTHTFGFAMTESGDRFVVNTTAPAIYIAPLPWRYLVRNPDSAVSGLESITGDRRAWSLAPPHPWRQRRADDPEYFKYYNSRYGAAESEADGWFTAACGPLIYQDHALPGLHGQYFVCEPAGNLIHRASITENGAVLDVHRVPGEEKSEFAASRDPWCHPMNLTHGPDGAIWIVDYYREVIEDYSAIPRHLQQQYGVYQGHDCGRIYRLTHDALVNDGTDDLSSLADSELAEELASPTYWRRQTANRLLIEREANGVASQLRQFLSAIASSPSTRIASLRTLDGLGMLTPSDVVPLLNHADAAVRIHSWQLADRWFSSAADNFDAEALDAALLAAEREDNSRVLLQVAMSIGESNDSRAFAVLVRLARERMDIRWMDAALMSSLHARGAQMLAALLPAPGKSEPLLVMLAKSIAARGDDSERVLALSVTASAPDHLKQDLLRALSEVHEQPVDNEAMKTEIQAVRKATAEMEISDATFREYTAALGGPRDLNRGHQVFIDKCAACHQIGKEGHVVGPDLLGELGVAEETLVRHLLLPNERIRPGFETILLMLHDERIATGLLKDESATSLTLLRPDGIEQVVLRKDISLLRRLPTSLMPSFASVLSPADTASLLAWLRTQLRDNGPTSPR